MTGPLNHDWIAARIPHHGNMCLLDQVATWSEQGIVCIAHSHRSPGNPLVKDGKLGIANGIEYAAQAMAVHGALLAASDKAPRAGYLTSVREVAWTRSRLDNLGAPLHVHAERLTGDANNIIYAFRITCEERELIHGRASVRLDASAS